MEAHRISARKGGQAVQVHRHRPLLPLGMFLQELVLDQLVVGLWIGQNNSIKRHIVRNAFPLLLLGHDDFFLYFLQPFQFLLFIQMVRKSSLLHQRPLEFFFIQIWSFFPLVLLLNRLILFLFLFDCISLEEESVQGVAYGVLNEIIRFFLDLQPIIYVFHYFLSEFLRSLFLFL